MSSQAAILYVIECIDGKNSDLIGKKLGLSVEDEYTANHFQDFYDHYITRIPHWNDIYRTYSVVVKPSEPPQPPSPLNLLQEEDDTEDVPSSSKTTGKRKKKRYIVKLTNAILKDKTIQPIDVTKVPLDGFVISEEDYIAFNKCRFMSKNESPFRVQINIQKPGRPVLEIVSQDVKAFIKVHGKNTQPSWIKNTIHDGDYITPLTKACKNLTLTHLHHKK